MQSDNLIKIIVGGALGVLLLVTLALPVIASATETHTTFTNEGAFYVEVDPDEEYTIKYDLTDDPNNVKINNIDVPISANYTFLALDKSILRMTSVPDLQYKGDGQYLVGISKIDLSISEGNVTGTYSNSITTDGAWPTTTYTKAYIASPTAQDLVMSDYSDTPIMLGDSEFFAFGQTGVGNVLYLFKITGTIDDGATIACLDRTTGEPVEGATITNVAINKTAVAGYVDLYEVTSITFTVTISDKTVNATYTAYIVPSEVTAEKAVHLDSTEITMIELIPLLLAVALVLGIIAYAVRARLS